MEPCHSTSSPLPSRAILIIGLLGFMCVLLLALLVLQFAPADGDDTLPALQVAEQTAEPESRELEPRASAPAVSPMPLGNDAAASLQSAYDEPVLAELAAFFDAVHTRSDGGDPALPPPLQAYAEDLVQRLNVEAEAYSAAFHAPDPAVADSRANTLQTLFLDIGLDPSFLTFTGRTGSDGVVVERS